MKVLASKWLPPKGKFLLLNYAQGKSTGKSNGVINIYFLSAKSLSIFSSIRKYLAPASAFPEGRESLSVKNGLFIYWFYFVSEFLLILP